MIMDKAHEGDETRPLILDLEMEPVVPLNFRRFKRFRRIFSRFEKLDVMFVFFIHFALIAHTHFSVKRP